MDTYSSYLLPSIRSSPSLSSATSGSPPLAYASSSHGLPLPPPYQAHYIKQEQQPLLRSPPPPQKQQLRQQDSAAAAAAKLHRDHLRKVSHSAIERRRRERINDKIAQLKSLVPACANQDSLHKLRILEEAIDYIRDLKRDVADARGHHHHRAEHHEYDSSPLQAPHPHPHQQYPHPRPYAPLPSPPTFATHPSAPSRSSASACGPSSSSSSSAPPSPASSCDADFDDVPGARELLLLSGQHHHRIMRPSPEPSEPTRGFHYLRPQKMSVNSLLC
ncbi:hypothetical protein HDU86_004248 [Geranomyces michiganensis]|nr:hypothetical protein HDU86_004248 [Geranomyces michiganensis]